jgi:metal-responsive CopG/Arc/MetJ family transcriptional regulator
VKVSVSLPADVVAFVDDYATRHATSRSAALHDAIELLRLAELEEAYEESTIEWMTGEDAATWDTALADGLGDAPR